MANPRYHSDPEFYERPGQTVDLHVDANPAKHVVPAMPWVGDAGHQTRRMLAAISTTAPCQTCHHVRLLGPSGLCDYCARAQARDETHKARAREPQPSRPRISIRQPWEAWQADQAAQSPEDVSTGHVREYETRIA